MSYEISHYDPEYPQLRIVVRGREISFTICSVDPKSHEWLGQVLDRSINELVDILIAQALNEHKHQLQILLGIAK